MVGVGVGGTAPIVTRTVVVSLARSPIISPFSGAREEEEGVVTHSDLAVGAGALVGVAVGHDEGDDGHGKRLLCKTNQRAKRLWLLAAVARQ